MRGSRRRSRAGIIAGEHPPTRTPPRGRRAYARAMSRLVSGGWPGGAPPRRAPRAPNPSTIAPPICSQVPALRARTAARASAAARAAAAPITTSRQARASRRSGAHPSPRALAVALVVATLFDERRRCTAPPRRAPPMRAPSGVRRALAVQPTAAGTCVSGARRLVGPRRGTRRRTPHRLAPLDGRPCTQPRPDRVLFCGAPVDLLGDACACAARTGAAPARPHERTSSPWPSRSKSMSEEPSRALAPAS